MDPLGVADFSSWGKLVFRGPDRAKFLQGLLTNDVHALALGEGQRTCVLTPKGRLVADFFLYNRGEDFLALCRPESTAAITAALSKIMPLSKTTMEDATRTLSASSVPGGLKVLSAADLEVLRVEAGVAVPGVDFGEDAYPLELGLEGAISFTKGCFMGQETTAYMKNRGHANRRLVGLKLERRPALGSPVLDGEEEVGRVTSLVESPRLKAVLGLALLKASAGARLKAGGIPAETVTLPL